MGKMNRWDNVEYLGDGVYVGSQGIYLKLMADDHLHPSNVVYIEEETFKELVEYIKLHTSWIKEEE